MCESGKPPAPPKRTIPMDSPEIDVDDEARVGERDAARNTDIQVDPVYPFPPSSRVHGVPDGTFTDLS